MKHRCNNSADPDYGGRGISYDAKWENFEAFFLDMGEPPEGMSIDRRDNNGSYCKDNCRWATPADQANNRRSNRKVVLSGEVLTIAQAARRLGMDPHPMYEHLPKELEPTI